MKIRLFEQFSNIDEICKNYRIENYTINTDGTVDVRGSVIIVKCDIEILPLRFGVVTGSFGCGENRLSTLLGSPRIVTGYFDCCDNNLTTLEGGPEIVGGSFLCSGNKLTSLMYSPKKVGDSFFCSRNNIYTLDGITEEIGGISTFKDNPIHQIYKIFGTRKKFMASLDWGYIRGKQIIRSRFEEACEEAGIEFPKYIEGYKYI